MSTLKVNAITDLSDSPKYQPLLLTAQTASGTAVDFTGIPSWVKKITVMFNGVSTNGTSLPLVRLGTSGGVVASGYLGSQGNHGSGTPSVGLQTAGFGVANGWAASTSLQGLGTLARLSGNTWAWSIMAGRDDAVGVLYAGGTVTLSDTLTQVRITTVNGTDTFDAGSINILVE
jgi:hypothetical protein